MMAREEVNIDGMHCASCGMLIDDALEDLPGVRSSTTSIRRRRCTVEYDPALTPRVLIVETIEGLGYRVTTTKP